MLYSSGIYHRVIVINGWCIAWRWLPLLQWRYLPRAWQGFPPAGYVLACDWTGRDRELIGWAWPFSVERVEEDPDPDNARRVGPPESQALYHQTHGRIRRPVDRVQCIESYERCHAWD